MTDPLARLVPIAESTSTEHSVTLLTENDELYFSTGESWDADG